MRLRILFIFAVIIVLMVAGYGCGDEETAGEPSGATDGDIEQIPATDGDLEQDFDENEADKPTETDELSDDETVKCTDDGLPCTEEVVQNGICQHVRDPNWCIINNQCVERGEHSPNNQCFVCNPDIDPMDWTPAPNGTSCDDSNPCTENDACTDGECSGVPKNCDDGISCTNDSCDPVDGSCIHSPDNSLCGAGEYCDPDEGCKEGVCPPDETVCVDDTHYQTCNADGSGYVEPQPVECENYCYNGECVDCLPPSAYCYENTPVQCVNGFWQTQGECQDPTPICLNGECVECTPGQQRCNGNSVEQCNEEGSWEVVQNCVGQTPVCIEDENGTPTCAECNPLEDYLPRCNGNSVEECINGYWTTTDVCSDDTPVCLDGECVECMPPQRSCSGDSVIECIDGYWTTVQQCEGPSPACVDGACVVCNEGEKYCRDNAVYVCNSNGEWVLEQQCRGDTPVCSNGECVVCIDGQRSCNGQIPLVCENGVWHEDGICIGDTPVCLNGNCVVCIPGNYKCDNNSLYVCSTDANGAPYWELVEECQDGFVCDTDLATCVEDSGGNYGLLLQSRVEHSHALIDDADEFDPTGPITIEAWIYPTEIKPTTNCNLNGHMIVEKWITEPSGQGNYMLAICGKRWGSSDTNDPNIGDLRFGIIWWNADGTEHSTNWTWFDDVIYPNQWSHIAAVWDRGEIRLYLNGALMHRAPIPEWSLDYNADKSPYDVEIGQLDNWAPWAFIGIIDEVRISRGARYTDNFQPPMRFEADESTVGLWHFDEGSGTTAYDSSGYSHNATLDTNASWSEAGVGEQPE